MATKKGGAPKARKPKAEAPTVGRIKRITIEVPHTAEKTDVHERVKAALHHKKVTDAVEERNPVLLHLVDNGIMRKG